MLQLIIKDFRANGTYQLWSLAILFSISTLYIWLVLNANTNIEPELILYTLTVLLSSSFVSLLFFIQDDLSKTDEVFVSLPVTRGEVVMAKYVSSFLQLGFALFAHFLGFHLGILLHGGASSFDLAFILTPKFWLALPLVLVLFKSFSYPLYFRFGLSTGAIIHSIIQFFLLVTVIVSVRIFNLATFMNQVLEWISNQNAFATLALLIISFLLLLTGSIMLSIKLFKNKNI